MNSVPPAVAGGLPLNQQRDEVSTTCGSGWVKAATVNVVRTQKHHAGFWFSLATGRWTLDVGLSKSDRSSEDCAAHTATEHSPP
jgi:hypothetical protein